MTYCCLKTTFNNFTGPITQIASNTRGTLLCSASSDKSLKVFDVLNFDMVDMMKLDYTPSVIEWIHKPGDPIHALAVADADLPHIYVYDALGGNKILHVIQHIHKEPVTLMKYNLKLEFVVSIDKKGIMG